MQEPLDPIAGHMPASPHVGVTGFDWVIDCMYHEPGLIGWPRKKPITVSTANVIDVAPAPVAAAA